MEVPGFPGAILCHGKLHCDMKSHAYDIMNILTNFMSKSLRRLPPSALLCLAVLLSVLPLQPVCGQSENPFHANFITKFTSAVEGDFLHVTVTGPGQATYLGKTTAFTDSQFVSLIDGSITATYRLTAAGSDALTIDFVGQGANVDGGVTFSGSYTIVGGTGRFAGATGSGFLAGGALFLTPTDGIGAFAIAGTISR